MNTDTQMLDMFRCAHPEGPRIMLQAYRPHVYSLIASVVPNMQDAEELTQDTFLAAFRDIARFKPERGSLATWIYKIAYNKALSFISRKQPDIIALDEDCFDSIAVSDEVVDRELSNAEEQQIEALERELQLLPSEDRLIITLYYYEGCKVVDIAAIVDTTPFNIYHRLQRIRHKLYRRLYPLMKNI